MPCPALPQSRGGRRSGARCDTPAPPARPRQEAETSQSPRETPGLPLEEPSRGGGTARRGREFFKELFLAALTCWPFLAGAWTGLHFPPDMQCCTMHGLLLWLDGKSPHQQL